MQIENIGSRREVCWDEFLMDRVENISVKMHHPQFRNIAMTCDAPWEGNNCGFFILLPEQNRLRLYYRTGQYDFSDGVMKRGHIPYSCYAESRDGKTFERINVGCVEYEGRKDHNIILDDIDDNIFFFYDTNPDCPVNERYKALSGTNDKKLWYYASKDGIHYEKIRVICDDGNFDSVNVALWDTHSKQYFIFYRGVHGEGTENGKAVYWTPQTSRHNVLIRDVRVRTSPDFIHWSESRQIALSPERVDSEMYINQIQKYYRADHMFLGMPTRYVDRYKDEKNFKHLPNWKYRQEMVRAAGREGTAITDAQLMTSRDGITYRRTEEAFVTPGIETDSNWFYGNCYFAYGMVETQSDVPGAPNEISLYMGHGYHMQDVTLARYTIRLDGFFSWHCDYEPGQILTKPFVFAGDTLTINFATSAAGYVRIRMTDADGIALEGYDSGYLFGNSVERHVEFDKSLQVLKGKPVRMEISMSDAELYSFRFEDSLKNLL